MKVKSESEVTQSCPTFWTLWTVACQASLSITNSQTLLKSLSIKSVMPSNHLILCCPLLLLDFAKSLQSCPTLCDPIDGSPPGFPVPGILQARTLEWVAMKVKSESEVAQSCPTLATPWTAAYQAPPSMGFSRQEYWSGVPLSSPSIGIAHRNSGQFFFSFLIGGKLLNLSDPLFPSCFIELQGV